MTAILKSAMRLAPILCIVLYLSSCGSTSPAGTPQSGSGASGVGGTGPVGGNGGSGGGNGGGGATSGSSPAVAAYVYVSSPAPNGQGNQVEAYSAAPGGTLTALNGSPFDANLSWMAVNGSRLFGVDGDGSLDTYSIGSDGSLTLETASKAPAANNCSSLGALFLDHTGATLYALNYKGSSCSNNTYESYGIDSSTGALSDLGNSSANNWLAEPASFLANNLYAYSASCVGNMYWGIWGFQRTGSGLLTQMSISAAPPTPPSGYFYCPSLAAADTSNHVAFAMQPVNQQTFNPDKPAQLAAYTAAANGDLVTTNTAAGMPATQVGSVTDLKMSPSGNLLAVAGNSGIEVFHFNGANAMTAYTGLLSSNEIDQCFWDTQNHLYAISQPAGELYVFTVTASGYAQAQGSPYLITSPQHLIVQPE